MPRSKGKLNKSKGRKLPHKQKTWTVMVYMAAGTNEQTEQAAIKDIQEMQKVDTTDMNVLVQIDRKWPGFPQRYRIADGRTKQLIDLSLQDLPSMSSGAREPLSDFLVSTRDNPETAAERYLLVLWGHTFGLGFGRDHDDDLTLGELTSALEGFGAGRLDILGANTCTMSYAEAAFELRNAAKLLVASEISMPFAGWPYARILNEIARTPDIEAVPLAKKIVDHFMESYQRKSVALTVLDLKQARKLDKPVKALARALAVAIRNDPGRDQITGAFLDTAHGDVRPLIDLRDLCNNLHDVSDEGVRTKALAVDDFLKNSGFVLSHAAGDDVEALHGVGIFAPGVTGAADLAKLKLSEGSYRKLQLVKGRTNGWARLVYTDLKAVLDPMHESVAEFVQSTGAPTREDRIGVAQLVMSLDRAFVKLERTFSNTKTTITTALETPHAFSMAAGRSTLPARFQPPYLRLTEVGPPYTVGASQAEDQLLTTHRTDQTVSWGGRLTGSDSGPTTPLLDSVAQSLADLEDAVARVERTAKSVMTHGRFGLGDVDNAEPVVKPGVLGGGSGSEPVVKPGVLGGGSGSEPVVKPGVLGFVPWLAATNGVPSPSGTSSIVEMYQQVAWSLRLIEEAVGKLENVTRSVVVGPPIPSDADQELMERTREDVSQSLREVSEMVANAKQMARRIVAHPAYGLGPGVQPGLGASGRQQLALAGGLSSRFLRLL